MPHHCFSCHYDTETLSFEAISRHWPPQVELLLKRSNALKLTIASSHQDESRHSYFGLARHIYQADIECDMARASAIHESTSYGNLYSSGIASSQGVPLAAAAPSL
jgi:hypothetical protein